MIRFENVTKTFPNGTVALQDVSFTIEPAEFVFVVGPSGAGKTTILRLLLRELLPTSGSIRIDESNLDELRKNQLPRLRRQIGAAFQDYKLIADRTVAENVALVADIVKKTKEEIESHVKEILSLVGLQEKSELFPSQLSGGELQRTAIARALATQPKILFADEPTGNLDQPTAWEIMNLLLMINKQATTVIVATHNLEVVGSLDKRVIELAEGRVVRDTKQPKSPKKEESKPAKSEGKTEKKVDKEKGKGEKSKPDGQKERPQPEPKAQKPSTNPQNPKDPTS